MLLTQLCDIAHRAPATAPDQYGERPLTVRSTDRGVACELQQGQTSEQLVDRNTSVGDWKIFLYPSATISQWDLVEANGSKFEVVGLPELVRHPWAGGAPDHWESRLREVVG